MTKKFVDTNNNNNSTTKVKMHGLIETFGDYVQYTINLS